jgi:Ca2+-binding EF-hand superfamily protein
MASKNNRNPLTGSVGAGSSTPSSSKRSSVEETDPEVIMERVRVGMRAHGGQGLRGFARLFKKFDTYGRRRLEKADVVLGLKNLRIKCTEKEVQRLLAYWDRSGTGTLTYDDFLVGVRGDLNTTRTKMVEKSFKVMDRNTDKMISLADLKGVYNAKFHPDVIAGRITEDEALTGWLNEFKGNRGAKDGELSADEWTEYYKGVSSNIDSDRYFVNMMNSCWKFTGTARARVAGNGAKEVIKASGRGMVKGAPVPPVKGLKELATAK